MALSSHDELILLRKRARRRLVGAIVLVSIATVVLWNVVGHLPEQQMKPESIEIMGEASAPAASAPAARRAASQAVAEAPQASATDLPANLSTITAPPPAERETVKPVEKPAAAVAEARPKPEAKPEPKPEAKPEPRRKTEEAKPAVKPRKADPAAILEGRADPDSHASGGEPAHGKSVIQLAALSDPAKVEALRAKLAGIGVTAHFSKVETSKGEVTRVRVGPFASQAEAQHALQKLSRAGVSGIIINK
ncbi:SPOR domain-containing protein [Chromobacterium sp. ATCC 53434]|uniref:SPOR domain-containing protein n=1 Tax=Chromobacterium TaxID=535 RepID=UPI000C772490|nr:SPOR domain-containing protein [Chromobacterium sp. ATCC 53434]AUH51088.1 SPOR domain-containing protein [Chromobacterium sp. ATCC 53434]